MPAPRRATTLRALVGATAVALLAAGTATLAAPPEAPVDDTTPARSVPFLLTEDRDVDDRLPRPEDRYAMAGGCYALEVPGQGFVSRQDGALTVSSQDGAALPLHFQATRLGEYLLATNEGRDTAYEGAWWDVRGYVGAATTAGLLPADGLTVADAPGEDTEWRVVAAGDDPDGTARDGFLFSLPSRDAVLVADGGALALAPASTASGTAFTLRHVVDDDPTDADPNGTACATWPEVQTGVVGEVQPVAEHEADEARGFFEAHVHGMAFEFIGGELRCGRPWHEYGVEFALGSCDEEKNSLNRVLEVPLGGYGPDYVAEYEPEGWPEFTSWPKNRTLTHEQFYWRWLERAYAGGLRLMTNLLVDNAALCQLLPVKRNSCNEMDGVRLQAQRLFELQDYVDAQNGGPGEGWFRIVTSPTQARKVINDGRLAVVLGIETSALFDCTEYQDVPQCTAEQIDERLQEVLDMGVRQMELVNKFDNALTGVKGDGGMSGPVVNLGNKHITGHWWDMRRCEDEPEHSHAHGADRTYQGDEHDHTQTGPTDATPEQAEGVDALAGRVIDVFGTGIHAVAPVYGPGPHCNSRGLTPLGEHLIEKMVDAGMFFDPDHMSAKAQRASLDLLERLAAEERAAAHEQGRPARQPSVISSHSWANDVTYQRVYGLDGVVAPYAGAADSFARAWKQHRAWAAAQASPTYDFGMGYGADTNGLGGQPPPRKDPARSLEYTPEGFPAPIGGVRIQQHTSGLRTFDVTTEGVAMYGLFADWFQEARLAADELAPELGGGAALIDDMLDGAETYLQMWERAVYGGGDCVADGSTLQVDDLHAALGLDLEGFLRAVGQPVSRDGAAYRYCVEDGDGGVEVAEVGFGDDGRTARVDVLGPVQSVLPALAGTAPGPTAVAAPQPSAPAAPGAAPAAAAAALHDHASHDHSAVPDPAPDAPAQDPLAASLTSSPAGAGVGAFVLLAVALLVVRALADRRRRDAQA